MALLGSAGRSFRDARDGTPELTSYLGLQFTWGGGEKPEKDGSDGGDGR